MPFTIPIMVVIGNPPYSVSSSNKGKWIQNLIKDYKTGLNERNIQPLSDDYIKFIRFAEHFIEKNKSGIVAMITNNSFLDGIIHRQMRKHLLETFDEIYILDLHGNSKKKEKAPDGGKDENVFNIMQGVSISIFVRKTDKKKALGIVHHAEIYGKREDKFKALNESDMQTVKWNKLDYSEPYYFFVPKDFRLESEPLFSLLDLFKNYSIGIVFGDKQKFLSFVPTDYLDDTILVGAFDNRYTKYSKELQRARQKTMDHLYYSKDNIALLVAKQSKNTLVFVSNQIVSKHALTDSTYSLPLYLYAEDRSKVLNLKKEIVDELEKIVGKVTPENIFDYIYAVLHSPRYREKYKEFLKIDFPRVPYPKDTQTFKKLVAFGAELRSLHLLESPKVNQFITTYPISGSDTVEKLAYKNGKVFINTEQYFGNVPEVAWNFYIGGYQPARKWLKDRKKRVLKNADIEHYQKIIVALAETNRIMKEIDNSI